MSITIYQDLIQGCDEWLEARRGLLTASEMKRIITPSGKPAKNERMRAQAYELLAQRLTGYVEPHYVSDDMLRGLDDEIYARELYSAKYDTVAEVGFIVRDFGDFRIGFSPDGLVGDDGIIEVKSRRAKLQVETIIAGAPPPETMVQMQSGMLVTGRSWCDYLSYSGGLPMFVFRVAADLAMQSAILDAATEFESFIAEAEQTFLGQVAARRFLPTARRVEQEMVI